MKIKLPALRHLNKSTMLKVAAGVVLALTITGTVIAIMFAPPAAPAVAAIGSAIVVGIAVEVFKVSASTLMSGCYDEPLEHQENHSAYRYHMTKVTRHLEKSDSGNHLDETEMLETRDEEGSAPDEKPRIKPHP